MKRVYKRQRRREKERERMILEGVSNSIKRFSILNIE